MENKNNKIIMKTNILAITSIMTFSLLGIPNSVYADGQEKKIEIINEMNVDLTYDKVDNKQGVKVFTNPPELVEPGETKSFKVSYTGTGSDTVVGSINFEIVYYVEEQESEEKVKFGFTQDQGKWSKINCFVDTPSDVYGEHYGCHDPTIQYTFMEQ